ncbi:MAG: hypothetical protein ACI9R3_001714 [Verrucomicrobiales bacterium]|jgi:hypothetical protein
MKTHLKLIAGVALAAISSASAQENTTKPVGFRTETIKAGVFNLMSADLTEAVSAAGTSTGVAAGAITDDAADFTTTLADADKTYVVQITSGALDGVMTEVAVTSGTQLTSADDLAAGGFEAGDTYEVRAAKTLADLFGAANEAGLTSGSSDAADVIWVPNGDGTFTRYYYKVGGLGGDGWRSLANPVTSESGAPIVSSDAFFVQSRAAADKDLVIVGHVQTRAATVALIPGFNFISRIAPVGQTLGTTGLLPTLKGGSAADADLVWVPDGAGGYTRYYSKIGGLGGDGWRSLSSPVADASGTALSSGVIVQRKGEAANATVGVPEFYANL